MSGRRDPIVTRRAAKARIRAIADRRGATIPDHPDELLKNPFPLLTHLVEDAKDDDCVDGLALVVYMRGLLEDIEVALLTAGNRAGVSYQELGGPLGLTNPPSVLGRRRRLQQRMALRRNAQAEEDGPQLSRAEWVDQHGGEMVAAVLALLKVRSGLAGVDIEADLEDLHASVEAVPDQGGPRRTKQVGRVASRVRLLADDLTDVAEQAVEPWTRALALAESLHQVD